MKSILVPIDFSEQSQIALKMAAKLAKRQHSELVVLHMLELSTGVMANVEYIPRVHIVHLVKVAEQRLEKFLDRPYLKNLNIIPVIKHYKVFSEVKDLAEKHGSDLIVMGSHGTDGLEEIFIGSNTERVVRNSAVPVLVVKGELANFEPDQMVFACDFKEENSTVIADAIAFAKMLGAELKLVYVNTSGDNFLSTQDVNKRITKMLDQLDVDLEVAIYNDYTVEKGILAYAASEGADIIGIPTHGRKGLSHFFMGSIGEDIANHAKIPVVTFKI